MKKTHILTLVGANNIGAFLQAFALGNTLEKMGREVSYLTMPSSGERQGKLAKAVRYLKQGKPRLLLYKIKTGKKYDAVRGILRKETFSPEAQYEDVVIGSDEVWNVSSASFVHYPQYFGREMNASRIISYAPSCGNTTPEIFAPTGMDFGAFASVSARDANTCRLVQEIDGRTPEMVLDPTFLVPSYDPYLPAVEIKEDFILVYSYGMSKEAIRDAKAFSKKTGLPLYSVGTYNPWCKKNLIVSPFEFLAYLKAAKYVITSTFHGTALSINLKKQFAAYTEGSEKLLSLLRDYGLSARRGDSAHSFASVFEAEIDYTAVGDILDNKREASLAYLTNALCEMPHTDD